MRILKDFHTFNESSNINFGGSYLGRILNSTARMGKSIVSAIKLSGRRWKTPINNLVSSVSNVFNEDDVLSHALSTDSQTRDFAKKIESIVNFNSNLGDVERIKIINLIDSHQIYIKDFKKSSLKGLKKLLMKYKLELIFELNGVQDFKNKYNNLNLSDRNSIHEYNTSIDNLVHEIENTNLGLKYSKSLEKFKKTLENSKK